MPILTLQKQARELGRIRIGQVVRDSKGKTRPEKLDRFRFTSASEPLLQRVAALYGGTVRPWTPQGGGADAFEVIADVTDIPILVPPQPVSQYFEHVEWRRLRAPLRRGDRAALRRTMPLLGGPGRSDCKPTTRLRVVLRDVEGSIGVWRLESHGYYAAVELPDVAEFLSRAGGYVPGYLCLEERVVKREGKTRRFMVPYIRVAGITPGQLLSGTAPAAQLGGRADAPALPAAPSVATWQPGDPVPDGYRAVDHGDVTWQEDMRLERDTPPIDVDSVRAAIAKAGTVTELREMWSMAKEAGLTHLATERAAEIERVEQQKAAQASGNVDDLWASIMTTVPEEWSTPQIDDDFERVTGVDPAAATAEHMNAYLAHLASTKENV
jgi:hypothetical protein